MPKVPPLEVDETGWTEWQDYGWKFRTMCCDCGYSHDEEYKMVDGRLLWRVKVNPIATTNARRKTKKKKK